MISSVKYNQIFIVGGSRIIFQTQEKVALFRRKSFIETLNVCKIRLEVKKKSYIRPSYFLIIVCFILFIDHSVVILFQGGGCKVFSSRFFISVLAIIQVNLLFALAIMCFNQIKSIINIYFYKINKFRVILGPKMAILGDFRRFQKYVFAHNSVKKSRTEKMKIVMES